MTMMMGMMTMYNDEFNKLVEKYKTEYEGGYNQPKEFIILDDIDRSSMLKSVMISIDLRPSFLSTKAKNKIGILF